MDKTVRIYPDLETLCKAGAGILAERTRKAVARRGRFTMAVNGGSSAARTLELYCGTEELPWEHVYIFWGDDRFVPSDHQYSNYRLLKNILIQAIPDRNLYPVPTHLGTPDMAARTYETTIRSFFDLTRNALPVFDCAFNGMGPDGHTASIFPDSPPAGPGRLVVNNAAGMEPLVDRVTLTENVFNNSRCVLFSVAGERKRDKAEQVLMQGDRSLPAARIQPHNGDLIWLLAKDAGALLPGKMGYV